MPYKKIEGEKIGVSDGPLKGYHVAFNLNHTLNNFQLSSILFHFMRNMTTNETMGDAVSVCRFACQV